MKNAALDKLSDCFYCEHQKFQHADKDGVCLVGVSMNNPCPCIGFTDKEEQQQK